MNSIPRSVALLAILLVSQSDLHSQEQRAIANPKIDYHGFLRDAGEVGKLRELRRVTEERFIEMAAEPGTIVLDARSTEKYRMLHVRGAKNLSLPDFTEAELQQIIPDKTTRVLIYCNNNFENQQKAFPDKRARLSLNIFTFNTLYGYGYRNVYELGPLIDIRSSRLEFEGTEASK